MLRPPSGGPPVILLAGGSGNEVVPLDAVEVEVKGGGGVSSAGGLAKYLTGVRGLRFSSLGADSPVLDRMPKSSWRGSKTRASETSSPSRSSLREPSRSLLALVRLRC